MDVVVLSNGGMAFDRAMRAHRRTRADHHIRTDDRVGTYGDRCVKLRGLPWAANKGTVVDFFEGFKVRKGDITIDIQGGKNSGFAIVVLENEEEAQRAISELDKKEIKGRWIGVSAAELRRGGGGRRGGDE